MAQSSSDGCRALSPGKIPPAFAGELGHRPFHALTRNPVRVEDLIAQTMVVESRLDAVEILDAFGHAMGCPRPCRAYLKHAPIDLHVEGQDVGAKVGEHIRLHQDVPEAAGVLRADLALVWAGEAVDGVDWMMAQNELVPGIGMLVEDTLQPLGFDMAFAAQPRPEGMDEDHQQVAAPDPVRQPLLPGRPVPGQVEHLPEHGLAHHVVGRVVPGCMPQRDPLAIEPAHLVIEPMPPLRPQRVGVGREADDLIAGKEDELRLRLKALDHRVD
jgi:hypothetical protein